MAQVDFSIAGLLTNTFGVGRGKPFDSSKIYESRIETPPPYEDLPENPDEEGTEFVNMRNSLSANNPITGQPFFMPVQLGSLLLPNEPTIVITGKKNILETALVGSTRRGSVKELIAVDDYEIVIRGIAINYQSKQVYPEDLMKAIHDLYLKNESVAVTCALTNLLGIYRVVIRQITLPEMTGIQHAQAYELQCVSDEDFILELD